MTVSRSLLLTAGGTLLFAIHMKAPICSLLTLIRFRFLPFQTASSEDISQWYEVVNVFTFSEPRPRHQPDLLPVLPPPTDAGPATVMISGLRAVLKVLLRLSVCQAGEAGVPSLRHRQVRQGLVDVGRDEDGHAAVLLLHHLRVDLAGVAVLV